jgi:hypothetical protein
MSSITKEEFNRLVNDAIHLCKTEVSASPPFLQRILMIDWDTAFLVFDELAKAEIIVNVRKEEIYEEVNYIGEINHDKLLDIL